MPLTLEEFRATGRDVDDINGALDYTVIYDDDDEPAVKPGRVYAQGFYIEREPDGRWYLLIENIDWLSSDLAELEGHLYEYVSPVEND